MADIMRAYKVDKDKIIAGGISQGGNGAWTQVLSYPDLFAAAIPHVPCVSGGTGYNGTNAPGGAGTFVLPMIDSLRNVPVIVSAGESDATCAWNGPMGNAAIRDRLDALGYEYEYWSFPGMGHQFAMRACGSESTKPCAYTFEQDFLERIGPIKRVQNPTRVTLSVSDSRNEPMFGFEGDHAYWLSSVKLRDTSIFFGKVDVKSHGFGQSDRVAEETVKTVHSDYAAAAPISYHTYNKWIKKLLPAAVAVVRNEVDVVATNVRLVVIDGVRAKLDCSAKVNLQSDGETKVVIHGCLRGDADLDDVVSCADHRIARDLIGVRRGGRGYDVRVDMNDDGDIDQKDFDLIAAQVGKACS